MGLGYLLLAVKSEQDNYLVGNPQFTFFKGVYRKHTNFAIDNVFVNFVGETANNFGRKLYVDIPKNGDLVHRLYLAIDIESSEALENNAPLAYSFIEYVELFIGSQSIDKHYGEWLHANHDIFQNRNKEMTLSSMISTQSTGNKNTIYIPLRFWFNNDVGMSLPLIALENNNIRLEVKFNQYANIASYAKSGNYLVEQNELSIRKIQLLTEYIHLDTDERRLFNSTEHQYLITQVQSSMRNPINLFLNDSDEAYQQIQHRVDLRFNFPVKEIFWSIQDSFAYLEDRNESSMVKYFPIGILNYNYWRNFKPGQEQIIGAAIMLNGKDLMEELPPSYYRSVQQYQHHNGYGINFLTDLNSNINSPQIDVCDLTKGSGMYSYSFSFKPQDTQPSGSLNFSRLEKAQLKFRIYRDIKNFTKNNECDNINAKVMNIYAVNYNILKIASGMGALVFTN
jgi:hypothetical protein